MNRKLYRKARKHVVALVEEQKADPFECTNPVDLSMVEAGGDQ